jgi:hypothetical protein
MYFLKINGTDHLITKKRWGLKCTSQINLKAPPILPVFFTLVLYLSIQPSFQKKKTMKLDTNFGLKGLNYTKKNFKDQIENFDKKSLLQSTIICEIMNNNFMQGKNTNYFSFC